MITKPDEKPGEVRQVNDKGEEESWGIIAVGQECPEDSQHVIQSPCRREEKPRLQLQEDQVLCLIFF